MKSSKVLLPVLIILGLGIFAFRDNLTQSSEDVINKTEEPPKESFPKITFPLLGEARTIDLIDMELSFPDELIALDGHKVNLIGFMAPFDSLENMRRCQIVPSYVGCTFCSPPNLRQVVYITQGSEANNEQTFSFIEEPSNVTGTFRISLPGSNHEGKKKGFVYSIENAVVIPHTGDSPERAPGHANPNDHTQGQGKALLKPIDSETLIKEVASLMGREILSSISIKQVSVKVFGKLVREKLEARYSADKGLFKAKAFSLLGLLPQNVDLIDALERFESSQRVAISGKHGEQVLVLNHVPQNHPYVRLQLIGAICDALIKQNFNSYYKSPQVNIKLSEDQNRAQQALKLGIRNVVIRRYARNLNISTKIPPPEEFTPGTEWIFGTNLLNRWFTLPEKVGPYFVNFHIGSTNPLQEMDSALNYAPTSTIEFFRPRWNQDSDLWLRDPVSIDFYKNLTETAPNFSDVLGAGGIMPFLASTNSGHVVMTVSGQWAGDRWGVWEFPDGSAGLLLETRWQDETAALEFSLAIPKHPYQWFFPHVDGSNAVRLLRANSSDALNRLMPTAP